jgi:hypothetical protein
MAHTPAKVSTNVDAAAMALICMALLRVIRFLVGA